MSVVMGERSFLLYHVALLTTLSISLYSVHALPVHIYFRELLMYSGSNECYVAVVRSWPHQFHHGHIRSRNQHC
jgi:hypothetical protein